MKDLTSISLKVVDGQLSILDQQMLPHEENWLEVRSPEDMIDMVKKLKVRGAPLIGVASSMALAFWCQPETSFQDFTQKAEALKAARPTAVNLMNNIDSLLQVAESTNMNEEAILKKAEDLFLEDVDFCEQMAKVGSTTISEGDRILTHCNTGGLATVGLGTALGVIKKAAQQGKNISVYVDETRPLLQGGRLTAWELKKAEIPYKILCDNMAGALMAENKVDKIYVGSDRIACNGDFANKIGTYSLAVLAHYHKVPFYVVAPSTTIDLNCTTGEQIPIEMRKPEEVLGVAGSFGDVQWAPTGSNVYNPAFDVAPAHLVTGYIIDDHLFSGEEAIVNLKKFIATL